MMLFSIRGVAPESMRMNQEFEGAGISMVFPTTFAAVPKRLRAKRDAFALM